MNRCVNCGYEFDELTKEEPKELCQTCWSAYTNGYQEGYEKGRNK